MTHRLSSCCTVLVLLASFGAAHAALPADPEPGKIYGVRASAANEGVRVTVLNASVVNRYGPRQAPAGRAWVVLNTEWENIVPPVAAGADGDALSTAFKLPRLADMVYLVLDNARVARVSAEAGKSPGHLNPVEFTIAKTGDRLRGNLVFDVSDAPYLGWGELWFFDATYGTLRLPIGDAAAAPPLSKTVNANAEASNAILNVGVYGYETVADDKPTPGFKTVRLDVRAKSLVTTPAPPPKKGQSPRKPGPVVADWPDATKYLSLLVDGQYAYAPLPGGSFPASPRFLPDVPTGGQLAFRIPEDAKSVELVCTFAKAVQGGRTISPRPLQMRVDGSYPPKTELKPAVTPVTDKPFFVAVTKSTFVDTAAGQSAGDGKQFLLVDVTVANTGEDGETFRPREQLQFLTASGDSRPADAVTDMLPHGPPALLWIPDNGRRSFQVAFRVDKTEPAMRLAYAGVTKGDTITLPGGTGRGPVEAAKPSTGTDITATGATPAKAIARPQIAADKPLVKERKDFPSRVKAKQSTPPQGLAGVGLKPEQVNAAIDRGASALWKRTQDRLAKSTLNKFGDDATDRLTALSLIHANYHKKDKAFDAALRDMLTRYDPRQNAQTYENGLYAMSVEGYADTGFTPKLAAAAQWIVDQQGPGGTWGYGKRVSNEEDGGPKAPRRVLTVTGGRPPDEAAKGTQPIARHTASIDYTDGDNSATQYAVLGLHAAARSGFDIQPSVFADVLRETRDRQCENGSWPYTTGSSGYGSMTCAGICAVAIARHNLGEKESWNDESVERGLAWLNAYFRADDHPESLGQWVYYYLYSLERVGRILDTEFIGTHEWYPEGCRFLVDRQRPNGLWWSETGSEVENSAEIPSAFALLFLTRATPSLGERVVPQGPGSLKTVVSPPPGNRLYVILDCSGSMLEPMNGKEKFEIARDAVRTLINDLPDNSEVALRAYGYRLRAIQPGASEDTKLLVPLKALDRKEIATFVDGLRARGKTPLALSLEQAADDLRGAATPERPVTAVLLTDGGEDTQPRRDPVRAAAMFAGLPNVSLRVVGFDINRDDWSQQLVAMAKAAGGRYLPAGQADALQRELRAAVFGIPESCQVFDDNGRVVKQMPFGDVAPLEPGKYVFATTFAGKEFRQTFYVSPGEQTAITFDAAAIAEDATAAQAKPAAPPAPPAPKPDAPTPPNKPVQLPKPAELPTAKPKPAAAFCKSCGKPLKPGVKFCSNCGTKVD